MPSAREYADAETYLQGAFTPELKEHDHGELAVIEGELPRSLRGVFTRNSSNPKFDPPRPYHWFDGDGMIHAVEFEDGRARYRNRWVRTKGLAADEAAGQATRTGLLARPDLGHPEGPYKNTANTDLIVWQNKLLALWWLGGGQAYALSLPELATEGPWTPPGTMTAHAKVDPHGGDLVFIDYADARPPFLTHGVLTAAGELRRTPIELPGPRPQHDLMLTERFSVLLDVSMFADPVALAQGKVRMRFFPEVPTRVGLFDRRAASPGAPRWFELPPCYVYHFAAAWEARGQDGREQVIIVVSRIRDPLMYDPQVGRTQRVVPHLAHLRLEPQLVRWTLDLESGQAREELLDDALAEFPRIDDRRVGRPPSAVYLSLFEEDEILRFAGVRRVGLDANATVHGPVLDRHYPPGWTGGEVSVLPLDEGNEDEGESLLATFVTEDATGRSELWLLRASTLEIAARLAIPTHVPVGFHTRWVPGSQLGPAPSGMR
ncbi:carotenoid oxygenase family protein [Pseudenhygromyxa sp. WMMC2535]|uniref:carotenoid oxygenase family protein n=1 Tax=Pseudenhygromyxa sp. WMMC2535 TaxID=2712867 RepID=UPI0015539DA2|nr:carotenoid oxygenase family protein [Pseudenhygromyxa sp. WMMC2535]NVB40215.1 carotenoid oxygenase family protein [Pseudenhygromyxa sp. WMMC2535]